MKTCTLNNFLQKINPNALYSHIVIQIVSDANKAWTLKAKAKAKAWTLKAKAKASTLKAKAKAKAWTLKVGQGQGQGLSSQRYYRQFRFRSTNFLLSLSYYTHENVMKYIV